MDKMKGTDRVRKDLRDELEKIADETGDQFLADHLFWTMFDMMNIPQQRQVLKVARDAKIKYHKPERFF